LLSRCLASDPAQRYQSAADLAADLRRYLADLPLRGVSNRNALERWRKWRRRRPFLLPLLGLLLTGVVVAGVLLAQVTQQSHAVEVSLQKGEDHLHHQRYGEALDTFKSGAALANGLPFNAELSPGTSNSKGLGCIPVYP